MWTQRWGIELTRKQQQDFLSHSQMPRITGKRSALVQQGVQKYRKLVDIADFVNSKK